VTAVAWWGAANLLRALSIGLYGMYGALPDFLTITIADVILFSSYAVTWTGARVFHGRAARPGSLVTGATVWLLACQLAAFPPGSSLRGSLSAAIIVTFVWLTAFEFWRGRGERLLSRWPAIFIFFANGAIFLLRNPWIGPLAAPANDRLFSSAWLTVLSTEAMLASISTAFILLAMAKERAELRHKQAATIDPLTGVANRRAFFQDAARIVKAAKRPVALLMIDLDHFKSINDQFGHAIGDKVLEIFAKTAEANLRGTDLVGRLGGEEFAVLLPNATEQGAWTVAERLRSAFASAAATVDGLPVGATAPRPLPDRGRSRHERIVGFGGSGALSGEVDGPQSRGGRGARARPRNLNARIHLVPGAGWPSCCGRDGLRAGCAPTRIPGEANCSLVELSSVTSIPSRFASAMLSHMTESGGACTI
jgi:diguanylate cyclase (GGDEF)-like protein